MDGVIQVIETNKVIFGGSGSCSSLSEVKFWCSQF